MLLNKLAVHIFKSPLPEYLERYLWKTCSEYFSFGIDCIALVTHNGRDIILQLTDGVPTLLDPKMNPDIYWGLIPVKSPATKYVNLWSSSGFYKSMHLKEFLNQIEAQKKNERTD